jgi:porphobilinogen deaminase
MVPLGAWGRDAEGERLCLDAAVFDADGRARIFASETGPIDDPEGLGRVIAGLLRRQGAEALLRPL